jgi:uroporphyrinogen-III synthase
MRNVLITRPQPAAEAMAAKLRREGYGAVVAPLSYYVDLVDSLPDLQGVEALAFTSRYAVESFCKLSSSRDLPVFAVGSATAEAAHECGFAKVHAGGSDAKDLAEVVRLYAQKEHLKKILHAAGEDVARDLAALLKADGIEVLRVALYRAELAKEFPADVISSLKNGNITTITLFSARAARRFVEIFMAEGLSDRAPSLEMICLSERVAAEISTLPWRSVKVALLQNQESMMDCLRARSQDENRRRVMSSASVLSAFGGIRPLAVRLKIAASTVQGWKDRGTIPETRINDILAAALKTGIDLDRLWDEGHKKMENATVNDPPKPSERRRGPDRRQAPPVLDEKGHVRTTSYQGPDRRSGLDRRAYEERQSRRVQAEKWRFFNRSLLMGAFFFLIIAYIAIFLLAPELLGRQKLSMTAFDLSTPVMTPAAVMPERSLEGQVNTGIEKVQQTVQSVTETVQTISSGASDLAASGQGVEQLLQVLARAGALSAAASNSGTASPFEQMMQELKMSMISAPDTPIARQVQIQSARDRNPELNRVLEGVDNKDLEAAAALLLLNEFRSRVSSGRPFEDDLTVIRRLAKDDPDLEKAMIRLAPLAKKGVLTREGLQKEFKTVAGDIVIAKLKGEDVSVQKKILERLSHLVKVRRVDQIEGQEVDAVVARAQILLDKGDVDGAVKELKTLQGASAEAAGPFLQEAQNSQDAQTASDDVVAAALSKFSTSGGASLQQVFGDVIRYLRPQNTVPYLSPSLQQR